MPNLRMIYKVPILSICHFFPSHEPCVTSFDVQLEVVGDIANTIWQIKESVQNQKHWDHSFMMGVLQPYPLHFSQRGFFEFERICSKSVMS